MVVGGFRDLLRMIGGRLAAVFVMLGVFGGLPLSLSVSSLVLVLVLVALTRHFDNKNITRKVTLRNQTSLLLASLRSCGSGLRSCWMLMVTR